MIKLFLFSYLILPILAQALPEEQQCQSSLAYLTEENKLNIFIRSLPLSIRVQSILKANHILTIRDLIQQTERDLLSIRNLGKQALAEIKNFLNQIELNLQEENENIIPLSTLKQLTQEQKLNTPISSLPLSIRVQSALKSKHILTIEDLIQQTEKDLLFIRNLGKQALAEIKNFLNQIELNLQEDEN